jgi:hypothetical protein
MTNPFTQNARNFMLTSARLLERQLYLFLFEDGPSEPVLAALQAYQNHDGGFGHGLESDLRTPESQPLAVEKAFEILSLLDAMGHPMVLEACDFLESISRPDGGVPFTLPLTPGFPHTPWMQTPADAPAALNPTASLVALLLKAGIRHPWVERGAAFCHANIPLASGSFFHDVITAVRYLQNCGDPAWAGPQLERYRALVAQPGVVTLDTAAEGYVKKPLDWAPTPGSFFRSLFTQEQIDFHLRALAAGQQPDGAWPINWTALGAGAELEWRGWVTLEALRTLKAYGYLE